MSDSTATLTAGTFDEVVMAEEPILVDFWATNGAGRANDCSHFGRNSL